MIWELSRHGAEDLLRVKDSGVVVAWVTELGVVLNC